MNKKVKKAAAVRKTAVLSMLAAIFVICTYIQLPFVIPFTLQTMALSFCLALVGTRLTLWVLLVYTALGCVGLPVFSGFRGGISALFDPAGGFIMGFFAAALFYALLNKLLPHFRCKKTVVSLLSLIPLYLCGCLWYGLVYVDKSPGGIGTAFATAVLPYVLPDVIKVLTGAFAAERLKKILKNK